MPVISVILPAYNAEQYIQEAVQSILDQTFTDFELIVINDASTDNTFTILQSFSDNRIKIENNSENMKVVKCLNKGLELATGEFIARMDADDISLTTRLERQIEYFTKNPDKDVCGTWVQGFGKKVQPFFSPEDHEDLKAALFFHNPIIHPSVMFRRESLTKHNLKYEESFINAEDYGMWATAIDKLNFGIIPQILLKYRIHENNVSVISNKADLEIIAAMNFEVYKRFLQKLGASFTNDQLRLHFMIGFRQIRSLDQNQLQKYLAWLKGLVAANKKSKYFKASSFQNEIIKSIVYLYQRSAKTPATFIELLKTMFKIYSPMDYITFATIRIKRRSNYKKRIAQLETPYVFKPDVTGSNFYFDNV